MSLPPRRRHVILIFTPRLSLRLMVIAACSRRRLLLMPLSRHATPAVLIYAFIFYAIYAMPLFYAPLFIYFFFFFAMLHFAARLIICVDTGSSLRAFPLFHAIYAYAYFEIFIAPLRAISRHHAIRLLRATRYDATFL